MNSFDRNWLEERLGRDCSPVVVERSEGDRATVFVAHAFFRGIRLAAISRESEEAAIARLCQKVDVHFAELKNATPIETVEELNLVLEPSTLRTQATREFVRRMSRERAELELDLGVNGAHVFVDEATGLPAIAARGEDGQCRVWRAGNPVHGDDGPSPTAVPKGTPDEVLKSELRGVKRFRVRELLRCPACRGALADRDAKLACTACARAFPVVDGIPVLAARPDYDGSAEGKPRSSNTYGQQCLAIIEEHRDGWVLDCGSGSPAAPFYNVVHLELFAFPGVDVVTDGEALPFDDGTFDAVLSEAVLEHVKDPIAYLREVARVLKPGGRLRADAAFLQPFHAYPDHYFNMTRSGLALALEQAGFDIVALEPGPHQRPWVALNLLLNGFAEGIPDAEQREAMLSMTMRDVMARLHSQNPGPFDALTREAIDRLAAGFP
jgi:SAM-dependent methyltransferase